MMNPVLSVIIVNYNTADMIADCLASIEKQLEATFEVIVVDNASSDGSPERIASLFPWVRLVCSNENVGFAGANNRGFQISRGEYVFLLNPDTLLREGCLQTIVAYMRSHPRIGLAGTAVFDMDLRPHPTVDYSYPGHRYARDELKGLPGEIAWVLGASMVVRGGVMREVGGFDERYFLYSEDIDLCLGVRRKGWQLGYIPGAGVIHLEGGSERDNPPAEVLKKKLSSEKIFLEKHYAPRTVAKISAVRRLEARWRLFSLYALRPLAKNKNQLSHKIDRYRTVLEVYG